MSVTVGSPEWKRRLDVTLQVISVCSRSCPRCYARYFVRGEPYTASVESVVHDIRTLGRVGRIFLSGGEVTLYPEFETLLRRAREVTQASLWIFTNGAKLVEHAAATGYLDGVAMSVYRENSHAGASTDKAIMREYAHAKPKRVKFKKLQIVHTLNRGATPCFRKGVTISVMDGRVYGCCVAAGMEGMDSIPLTEGWEERVKDLSVPCDRCDLGEP